jgi:hypothetical protein
MGSHRHWRPRVAVTIVAIAICAVTTGLQAQSSSDQVGTSAAAFLKIGVGARASSMGGAFVAVADDASAGYWNAAGLTQLKGTQLTLMHSDLYQDLKLEYLAAGFPVGRSLALGVGISYLNYGSFDSYDASNQATGSYSANAYILSASAAVKITENLSLGLTGKQFAERLDESRASSYAADVSALYKIGLLTVGAQYSNIGRGLAYADDTYELPASLSAGFALSFYDDNFRLATGLTSPSDNSYSIQQGIEYCYENTILLRSGYSHSFAESPAGESSGLSVGFGVRHSFGEIDYSYAPDQLLGDIHRFSLTIGLDSK